MKITVLILICYFLCSSSILENCDTLVDGKYFVIYDMNSSNNFEIIIKDKSYLKILKQDSIPGKIEWISKKIFILQDNENVKQNDTSNLVKTAFGNQCFEITSIENCNVKFRKTYTGNLHLTNDKGVFIRDLNN